MTERILNQINQTEFFKAKELMAKSLVPLCDYLYEVKTNADSFFLYKIDREIDQSSLYDKLLSIGAGDVDVIDEINETDDKYKYILLYETRLIRLDQILESANTIKRKDLGKAFGHILYKLHNLTPDIAINWNDVFTTKSNYLFYMHGVSEIGDKDYILIDYIKDNIHLTKNIPATYLYQKLDTKNIFINDNNKFYLFGLEFKSQGDKVFDFVWINKIAVDYPEFARGVYRSYFKDHEPTIKFYRLLSLYQAYVILDNIVAMRNEKPAYLSKREIDGMLGMYDNYNLYRPNWIKES